MRGILNTIMWKVYVNYKSLFIIERQCYICYIYLGQLRKVVAQFLGDGFFILFLLQLNKIRTLSESKVLSFCFWCYQENGEREGEFRISLCYPRGLGAFPQFYRK